MQQKAEGYPSNQDTTYKRNTTEWPQLVANFRSLQEHLKYLGPRKGWCEAFQSRKFRDHQKTAETRRAAHKRK